MLPELVDTGSQANYRFVWNMYPDSNYRKTLERMLFVESLGECLYNALASKSSSRKRAAIYRKLSLNEIETANRIIDEMIKLEIPVPTKRKRIIHIFATAVFSVLWFDLLLNLLKRALKKGIFKTWFKIYHEYNENFWLSMIAHENLQYKLLELKN